MELEAKDNSLGYYIAIVVIILMAVGTVFVFSAAANVSFDIELQKLYDLSSLRQILFFPLAVIVMYALSRVDYRRFGLTGDLLKSPTTYLLGISIALLVLVLIPKIGVEINQARRWFHIRLGFMTLSFQPSELAKWAVLFFAVGFCDRFRDSIRQFWKRFVPLCAIIAVPVGLILIEDFGTAALISLLAFLILLIGGAKRAHLFAPLPFGAAAFVAALFQSPHRLQRIAAFLNPEKWADSVAYQANQSLIALGSGGVFGKGIGRGICKYGHLPEDTTDFIFAIIGEEFGLIGTLAVIMLFVIFVLLGIRLVVKCQDGYGRLLAAGIVLAIATQAALNIGVVTVVLPTKGLPLPFVSAGGTSMLLTAAAVGVLINIARQATANSEMAATQDSTLEISVSAANDRGAVEQSLITKDAEPAAAGEQRRILIREYKKMQASPAEKSLEFDAAGKKYQQEDAGPLKTDQLQELSKIAKRLARK